MNWEKVNKYLNLFILVAYLVITIPIAGVLVGLGTHLVVSHFSDNIVLAWILSIVLGALAGVGWGRVAYKDMTKKRQQ